MEKIHTEVIDPAVIIQENLLENFVEGVRTQLGLDLKITVEKDCSNKTVVCLEDLDFIEGAPILSFVGVGDNYLNACNNFCQMVGGKTLYFKNGMSIRV